MCCRCFFFFFFLCVFGDKCKSHMMLMLLVSSQLKFKVKIEYTQVTYHMIKIWMIGGNSIHFIYNPCTVNDLTHARSTNRDGTHTLITKPKTVLIPSLVSTLSSIALAILKTLLFNSKGMFQIGTKWPKLISLYHLVIYFILFFTLN